LIAAVMEAPGRDGGWLWHVEGEGGGDGDVGQGGELQLLKMGGRDRCHGW
jgi:hypothetical protein